MRQVLPRRRSLTKHASYPTAKSDRPHQPAEVNTETKANYRKTENELRTSKRLMDTFHRKSIVDLDKQRKVLEKSMVAYSAKMKEISISRTNGLFRELQTRNSSRKGDARKAVTVFGSLSSRSSISNLPSDLQRAHRHSEIRSLKGFSQVVVPSPVQEVRETPTVLSSRLGQTDSQGPSTQNSVIRKRSTSEYGDIEHDVSTERESVNNVSTKRDTCLTQVNGQLAIKNKSANPNTFNKISQSGDNRPGPRVQLNQFLWVSKAETDSLTDSAYNSGTEEEGSEHRIQTPDDASDSMSVESGITRLPVYDSKAT